MTNSMNIFSPPDGKLPLKWVFLAAVFSLMGVVRMKAQAPGGVASGLHVWFRADAGTSGTSDGELLTFWNDQSGNALNATQPSFASRPQFYNNIINGNPAVRTAANRYFNFDLNGISSENFTIFTVSRRQAGGSFQNILGIAEPGSYTGLSLGYAGTGLIRFIQYGNWNNINCPVYSAATEIPTILSCQFDQAVGKRTWYIRDGVQTVATNSNRTFSAHTASARIGRGNTNHGFTGYIAEVIIYERVLSAAEKQQVHTYLSVKYGLSVPGSEHLYYNEASYSNDVFGIGRNVASQALNQQTATSVSLDDILEISNPSSLDDGDYLICGNDNGATSFSVYGGSNCGISAKLGRQWRTRIENDPGLVTLRFDLSSLSGFDADRLALIIDDEGDGFDDETGIVGVYNAPYFEVSNCSLADGAIFTIGEYTGTWYAVATGNASGAVWSDSPSGTPQVLSSFCAANHLVVQTGVTINNDWPTLSCRNFEIRPGAVWNASSGVVNVGRDMTVNGTLNAQNSTFVLNGTSAQSIIGSGICNVYNFTVSNVSGVTIDGSGGGVRARNIVNILSGTLTTNSKLTLVSDASSTGMIAALTSGAVSGNVTAQRYHQAAAQGWVNLSSPVQGRSIQDWNDDLLTTGFTGADYPPPYSFNNVQYYNEAASGNINSGYVGVSNINDPIIQGRGYFVFMNAGVMNLDVEGQINSGNINLPVTYTATGSPSADGWNLIGNPYPCTIDWNSLSWTRTNINNAVYVWNAALGQYASYVGGVATNGGSRYIPSSQSFFVVANSASPVLTLAETCKSTNQGSFKSTEIMDGVLTLRLTNAFYSDETTLARNEAGTLNFDAQFDAYKLRSPLTEVPYMSSISADGEDLSVNAFHDLTEETIVPLRIETGTSGVYVISHQGLEHFARGACIVLEDLLTGESFPLNKHDKISVELQSGSHELRFQLRIGAGGLITTTSSGCPGMESGTATVFLGGGSTADVTWYNAMGEKIAASKGVNGYRQVTNLATGVYSVSIDGSNSCGSMNTEFYVAGDEPLYTEAVILPASCTNAEDGAIAVNVFGGVAPYNITWSNGMQSSGIEELDKGEYTAFVTDQRGCQATFSFEVPVSSMLKSGFETLHDSFELMNGAVEVNFYNTTLQGETFTWNFNDGTALVSEENPVHLFSKKGVYEVALTATDGNCESTFTKHIVVTNPKSEGAQFGSEMMGSLTDDGVRIMFFFEKERRIQITGYNVLGQQLIEPFTGNYERQTITFSDRRYASNALIEVMDLDTGERTLMRMGI